MNAVSTSRTESALQETGEDDWVAVGTLGDGDTGPVG